MNKEQFLLSIEQIIGAEHKSCGIGTLSERSLHAILKLYFEPNVSNHEVKVGRFVADIVNGSHIIEIQTRSFNALRSKLEHFLSLGRVTVVYPIAKVKWLCWIDTESGEVTKKRKSPKIGTVYDSFYELYKIKSLLTNPQLQICLVLLDITEYRRLDGYSYDKKKGSTRDERYPNDIYDEIYVGGDNGYSVLIPDGLFDSFSAKDYAAAAKINLRSAQTALNVLSYVGAVTRIGKNGNTIIYSRAVVDN